MGKTPGWSFIYTPTPLEWSSAFAAKQDELNLSLATTCGTRLRSCRGRSPGEAAAVLRRRAAP